jgi:hypothetical protein
MNTLERRMNKLENTDGMMILVVREVDEDDEAFTLRMQSQGLLIPGQRTQFLAVTTGVPRRLDQVEG